MKICTTPKTVQAENENKPRLMLSERVREVLRQKNYSLRTEEAYLAWIKRFIRFHKAKHPRDMGEKEIGERYRRTRLASRRF